MKAITIKQPWASLIVESDHENIGFGIKNIENRSWPTKYRGRVLVHAGLDRRWEKIIMKEVFTDEQRNLIAPFLAKRIGGKGYPYGAIIGSVEIVDCVVNHPSIWAEKTFKRCECEHYGTSSCINKCFNFNQKENDLVYNWVLANPIKFPKPIPAKGKLSFWEYPNILAEQ